MLIQLTKWIVELFTSTFDYIWPVYVLLIILALPTGIIIFIRKKRKPKILED